MNYNLTGKEVTFIMIWSEFELKKYLNYARSDAENLKRHKKDSLIYNAYKKSIRYNLDLAMMCKNILRKLK